MSARIPLPPPLSNRPFSTREGMTAGLGRQRLAGADLIAPFRGTRIPSDLSPSGRPSIGTLCGALATRLPTEAFFFGVTAAALWGAPLPRDAEAGALHVAVTRGTAPTGLGIIGHVVTVDPADLRLKDGLRVTSPARTWCDSASDLSSRDIAALGDFVLFHERALATRDELAAAVSEMTGRRGVRALRTALPLLSDRPESRAESHLRVLLVSAGLTEVAVNLPITTSEGIRYRATSPTQSIESSSNTKASFTMILKGSEPT